MTAEQARALADAIEARDRARESLSNAAAWGGAQDGALGAEQATQADERLAAAGEAYVAAQVAYSWLVANLSPALKLGDDASGPVDAEDPIRPHAA